MIKPFKFKWIIDDKLIEGQNEWNTENYKRIYFSNGRLHVGIKNNYHFFIDNNDYDFKIIGEFVPFQLKTNSFNLQTGKDQLIAYTIGFKNDNEQYNFTIKQTGIMFFALKDGVEKILLIY